MQVELINTGDTWLIPGIAIAISLGTLIWTRIDRYRDKARISVSGSSFSYGDIYDRPVHQIAVVVTNIGHQGKTVLDTIKFKAGKRGGIILALPIDGIMDKLPKTLEPGESATLVFNRLQLVKHIRDAKIEPTELRIIAKTGHGETSGRLDKSALSFITPELDPKNGDASKG